MPIEPRFAVAGQSRAGWHRIAELTQCRRRGGAAVLKKQARVWDAVLLQGHIVHAGLQHHYLRRQSREQGRDPDEWMTPCDAMRAAAKQAVGEGADAAQAEQVVTRIIDTRMIEQYVVRYNIEPDIYTVEAVESELETQIEDHLYGRYYLYTQRADLILRRRGDGMVFIIDHKTAGFLGPQKYDTYVLSGQRAGYYYLGQRTFGADFGGVIFSFLCPPKASDPAGVSWQFARPAMPEIPAAVADFPQTVIEAERWLLDFKTRNGGALPEDLRLWPPVLLDFGGPCPRCHLSRFCQEGAFPVAVTGLFD